MRLKSSFTEPNSQANELTKLELIASIALGGLLANPYYNTSEAEAKLLREKLTLEKIAIKQAEYLIEELNNGKK